MRAPRERLPASCKFFAHTVKVSVVVVLLGFYVSPTATVIRRRDLGLKSHPKDWKVSVSVMFSPR